MKAKIIDIGEKDMFYDRKERFIGQIGDFRPDGETFGEFTFDNPDFQGIYYFAAVKVEPLPYKPIKIEPVISGGTKHDEGKLRFDLIPPEVELALGEILTYGAKKYEDRNWEKGIAYGRIYGALRRHLLAWLRGEKLDAESGKPHLWHALCCLSFLVTYEERGMGATFDNLHNKP